MHIKKLASSIDELPELKRGFVRVVHLADARNARKVVDSGLDYERYGMLSSTATWWSNPKEVKYSSDDPRFSGEHIKAVVMDVPSEEVRIHNDPIKSPGNVPSKYVVGVVDAHKEQRKYKK